MTNMYKQVGERILLTRLTRGYTREKLADLAGITPRFLFDIETGRRGFSIGVLYGICHALDVSCDYIITGNEKNGYDKSLTETLALFNKQQIEYIINMLRELHKIL